MKEDAEQGHHDLRDLFNGLRYVTRYGVAGDAERSSAVNWGLPAIPVLDESDIHTIVFANFMLKNAVRLLIQSA